MCVGLGGLRCGGAGGGCELVAGPAKGELVVVMGAAGDVAGAGVAEHEVEVGIGVDLEDEFHFGGAFGAGWILGALDPVGPAAEFFSVYREGQFVIFFFFVFGEFDIDVLFGAQVFEAGIVVGGFPADDLASAEF